MIFKKISALSALSIALAMTAQSALAAPQFAYYQPANIALNGKLAVAAYYDDATGTKGSLYYVTFDSNGAPQIISDAIDSFDQGDLGGTPDIRGYGIRNISWSDDNGIDGKSSRDIGRLVVAQNQARKSSTLVVNQRKLVNGKPWLVKVNFDWQKYEEQARQAALAQAKQDGSLKAGLDLYAGDFSGEDFAIQDPASELGWQSAQLQTLFELFPTFNNSPASNPNTNGGCNVIFQGQYDLSASPISDAVKSYYYNTVLNLSLDQNEQFQVRVIKQEISNKISQ